MRKKLLLLLVCSWTAVCVFAQSGTCGANLTWNFDSSTGTLTISGTGAMRDYSYSSAPWYSQRSNIKILVIQAGITTLGNYAFY